jgi:hypothetical protein
MKHLIIASLAIVLSAVGGQVLAQQISGDKLPKWQTFQSENGELSVEMPANATRFYDKDGFVVSALGKNGTVFSEMQVINANEGATIMRVEIFRAADPKSDLKEMLDIGLAKGRQTESKQPGFTIKQIDETSFRGDPKVSINFVVKYITSPHNIYVLSVANRGNKSVAFDRFLSSLKLTSQGTSPVQDSIPFGSIKARTLADIAEDGTKLPQSATPLPDADKNTDPNDIVILTSPFPTYMAGLTDKTARGTLRMRITFTENGSISKIIFLSSLSGARNRSVFFELMRTTFLPRERDGTLVSLSKVIEFTFG